MGHGTIRKPFPQFYSAFPGSRPCGSSDVWTDRCLFCHGFLLFPDNGYRECLANGSWAARVNYSECQEILNEEVRIGCHTEGAGQGHQYKLGACHMASWGLGTFQKLVLRLCHREAGGEPLDMPRTVNSVLVPFPPSPLPPFPTSLPSLPPFFSLPTSFPPSLLFPSFLPPSFLPPSLPLSPSLLLPSLIHLWLLSLDVGQGWGAVKPDSSWITPNSDIKVQLWDLFRTKAGSGAMMHFEKAPEMLCKASMVLNSCCLHGMQNLKGTDGNTARRAPSHHYL